MSRHRRFTTLKSALLSTCSMLPVGVLAEEFTGHVEVGFREVDVQGDVDKYDQYINLDDGARLFGFRARFMPAQSEDNTPDLVELNVSGLGGDPYERVDLTVKNYGAYRFRWAHQRSDYFYQDILVRPQDASVEGSTGGDFHRFDFERIRDTASLGVDVSERAKLTFDFNRYDKRGDSTTTLDVQREEFELDQPIDETLRSATVGFQYAWDRATLVVSEQRQHHENDYSWFLPGFSLGTEPAEPTELDFFFIDQPYQSDSREHAIGVNVRPTDKLEMNIDIRDVDVDLDIDVAERSQGADFLGVPVSRDVQGGGKVARDTLLFDVGANYLLTQNVAIGGSVRRYRLDQDGAMAFDGSLASTDWTIENSGFELFTQAALTNELNVSIGWHGESRDTKFLESTSTAIIVRDEDTEQDGYFLEASYQPSKKLRLTLAMEDNRIDDPFTRASATDAQTYRLRGHYRFNNGLSVTASHRRTDYENDNTHWQSTTDQTDVHLAYAKDRWTLAAGFALLDLEREIDQLVSGGFRQDLFAIRYRSDATIWDASADFQASDRLVLSASFRTYDNEGTFDVERDDVRLSAGYTLRQGYVVYLSYRNADYEEGNLEAFDADIWEVSLRYGW